MIQALLATHLNFVEVEKCESVTASGVVGEPCACEHANAQGRVRNPASRQICADIRSLEDSWSFFWLTFIQSSIEMAA